MRTIFYISTLFIILAKMIFSQSIVELNSPFSSAVRVLYMSKTNTLFAGGDIGFFKTTDLGQTWDTILTQNIRSIYLYNDSTWYLCTFGGIYKTTDFGESWIPFGQSLPSSQVTDLAINSNNNSIFAVTNSGLYRSYDEGNNWSLTLNCYPTDNAMVESIGDTIIFLGKSSSTSNYDNLYRSSDNGSNWDVVDLGSFRGRLYKTPGNILFLEWKFLTSTRLYKSTNGGLDWLFINDTFSTTSAFGPWTTGLNNSLIMQKNYWMNAGAYGVLLLVSFNNFQTVTQYQLWLTLTGSMFITSLTTNPNEEIFAGLADGKIRKIAGIYLPVELTTFTGFYNYPNVELDWATATELNNNGFEIQRSFDSLNWVTVGFERGNGTTTEPKQYCYVDNISEMSVTKLYYRLKQVDFNGSFEYSEIAEVEITPTKFSLNQNYPNPFNPSTSIQYAISSRQFVTLKVYNVLGKEVATLVSEEKIAGTYEIEFSANKLSSGVYYYQLRTDNFIETKKMIYLK